jgi:hypothetical protein
MSSRYKDIIFLLGAGASAEAGIPTSGAMIDEIECLLNNDGEWRQFQSLYYHIKSAIYYAAGLKGLFDRSVLYNIETLVNTLYELERNEQHPLYPFIASWNSRLASLAGHDFASVKQFRHLILHRLKKWVSPDDVSKAEYFQGFVHLQESLTYPLRIFSLNYDLGIERLSSTNFSVESGFSGIGSKHCWDWERFEEGEAGEVPQIYLYKLHGSIHWKRNDATKELFCVEQNAGIEPEQMEVIFGREFKLEAADPYLFYAYEFRKFTLEAKLVVTIGYGFGDAHINKMLSQSLKDDGNRRILAICHCKDGDAVVKRAAEVTRELDAQGAQVIVRPGTAKEFLESERLAEALLDMLPKPIDDPF